MNDSQEAVLPAAEEARPVSGVSNQRRALAAIRLLRLVAILEGASFLVLLGIAMPLKYFAGMPEAVRVTGTIHGGLFLLYVAAVLAVAALRRWSLWRTSAHLAASVLPLAPFVAEGALRREQRQIERGDV